TDSGKPNDRPPTGFPVSGADASGNVLDNDNDVDGGERATDPINYGETMAVTGVRPLRELVSGPLTTVPAGGSTSINGTYGTLTIASDGSYTYVIDNSNTAVQRLGPNDSLIEYFSYQVSDAQGLNDLAELRITVVGNYDNPVASDDQASAQAGASNADPESNPTGNVILFPSRPGSVNQPGGNGVDLDVDSADRPSSVLLVNGVRNGPELAGGTLTSVTGGAVSLDATFAQFSNGTPVGSAVNYGTLTINPDGSFSFDVNSDNPEIIALPRGATINVIFTYQIVDSAGLTDTAQLVIVVRGANNPPHAQDSISLATEKGGINNGTPGLDPGVPPGPVRQVSFTDPDTDPVTVTGIRTGAEGATGTAGTVGT
ncbi:MAG: VCBS domain-containing protein, partial [Pseudomonas sp.]